MYLQISIRTEDTGDGGEGEAEGASHPPLAPYLTTPPFSGANYFF